MPRAARHRSLCRLAVAALCVSAVHAEPAPGPTLTAVRARGYLQCSASLGTPGFGFYDSQGVFRGLDADFCRAVAGAVLGDPAKVRFQPLSGAQRLTSIQTGQVDILIQTLTWSQSREAANGLEFAGINFYDGQSFLVRASSGARTGADLAGASICVGSGSTSELNLADWAGSNHVPIRPVVFERNVESQAAYESGRCDAISTDASQLAATRTILQHPEEHLVLPDRISKEPLGPAVRKGDEQWLDIVKWTLFALINAEELGVTQANAEQQVESPIPAVRRLVGASGEHGKLMGLDNAWALRAIRAVGNYGEMYERYFGPTTAINLPRGRNELWNRGGLIYAPPIR